MKERNSSLSFILSIPRWINENIEASKVYFLLEALKREVISTWDGSPDEDNNEKYSELQCNKIFKK